MQVDTAYVEPRVAEIKSGAIIEVTSVDSTEMPLQWVKTRNGSLTRSTCVDIVPRI